jgi:hypothetical protein
VVNPAVQSVPGVDATIRTVGALGVQPVSGPNVAASSELEAYLSYTNGAVPLMSGSTDQERVANSISEPMTGVAQDLEVSSSAGGGLKSNISAEQQHRNQNVGSNRRGDVDTEDDLRTSRLPMSASDSSEEDWPKMKGGSDLPGPPRINS